jgi:hypothetical protein
MLKSNWVVILTAGFLVLFVVTSLAPTRSFADPSKRQKVIDFEDELVEGMNKKPLDSLNQISDKDRKKKKPHLYRKRVGFKAETADTMHVLRYAP